MSQIERRLKAKFRAFKKLGLRSSEAYKMAGIALKQVSVRKGRGFVKFKTRGRK